MKCNYKPSKKTPFWVLFDAIYNIDARGLLSRTTKYERNIRQIMKCYDMRSKMFIIAGEQLEITSMDVQLILGVTGGASNIPIKLSEYVFPPWVYRCFETTEEEQGTAGKYQLYKAYIMDRLKVVMELNTEQGFEDVARLVHCYLLASLLATTRNGSVNWFLTCYCESIEDMYTYDWCGLIVRMLMNQIHKTKSMRLSGYAMLLTYWLCEHTRLIEPCEDSTVPRFLRWDLRELRDRLKRVNLTRLKSIYIRKISLTPYTWEKDTFRSLKFRWDNNFRRKRDQDANPSNTVSGSKNNFLLHETCKYQVSTSDDDVYVVDIGGATQPVVTRTDGASNATRNDNIVGTRPANGASPEPSTLRKSPSNLTDSLVSEAPQMGGGPDCDEINSRCDKSISVECPTYSAKSADYSKSVKYDTTAMSKTTKPIDIAHLDVEGVDLMTIFRNETDTRNDREAEIKDDVNPDCLGDQMKLKEKMDPIAVVNSQPSFDLGIPTQDGISKKNNVVEMPELVNDNNKACAIQKTDGNKTDTEAEHQDILQTRDTLITEVVRLKKIAEFKENEINDLIAIQVHKDEESRLLEERLRKEIAAHVNRHKEMQNAWKTSINLEVNKEILLRDAEY